MNALASGRRVVRIAVAVVLAVVCGSAAGLLGLCGPFTDVAADAFCPFVLEIFYLGITTGTTPSTYDPAANVSRLQMAAFLSRTVDTTLKRGGRRALTNQLWNPGNASALGVTTLPPSAPRGVQFDGADLWVSATGANTVPRLRASDGRILETWTGASTPGEVLVAMSRVFVAGLTSPGRLYSIDPSQPAGAVTTVASGLGNGSLGIAFDGERIWTTNSIPPGSVSIVTPGSVIPWTVTTVTVGTGMTQPIGALYDGANVWITDSDLHTLLKLNSSGTVLQTVTVGASPLNPGFDGTNLWIPNFGSNSVSVVRASSGAVVQTLTGNGLDQPRNAGFDEERLMITNDGGDSVSLWKAADLTPLGSFSTGAGSSPHGVCSDGTRFWIALFGASKLVRF